MWPIVGVWGVANANENGFKGVEERVNISDFKQPEPAKHLLRCER
jgi:hypothetical protein